MNKLVFRTSAFLLGSAALAGVGHATSSPWATNPAWQSAAVQAGMNHMHPTTDSLWVDKGGSAMDAGLSAAGKNVALTSAQLGEKQIWLAQANMPAEEGKNVILTVEQVNEKQLWLAQNPAAGGAMAMTGGKGEDAYTGQGGAAEMVGTGGQPVWPACRPGAGDDNCIQLYERGVSRAYAQWSAGRSGRGMGGPEEPATGKHAMDNPADAAGTVSTAAKPDSGVGPTTEPTGILVAGKASMSEGAGTGG